MLRSLLIAGALLLSLGASCAHTKKDTAAPRLPTEVEVGFMLEHLRERVKQVSGTYKARSTGLEGFVASTDLDVVAARPGKLHLAVRSFFGQPTQVLATDGEDLWLYDASGGQTARFFNGPASPGAVERLLGVPLSPDEAVDVLLASTPAGVVEEVDGEPGDRLYRALVKLQKGGHVRVLLTQEHHQLESFDRISAAGDLVYSVRYTHEGLYESLPKSVEIRLGDSDEQRSLLLEAKDIEVDGPAPDPLVFSLAPPPGFAVEPL